MSTANNSIYLADIRHHIFQLSRLRVPESVIFPRPCPGAEPALQAAVNVLDEIGFDHTKTGRHIRTKPKLYALMGWHARGPHDPDVISKYMLSVRKNGAWEQAQICDPRDFCRDLEKRGWIQSDIVGIHHSTGIVGLVRARGWMPSHDLNYFQIIEFTRDQYH